MTEARDPVLVARMEALVRQLGAQDAFQGRFTDEARAIVDQLPEPADPDEEIAAGILDAASNGLMSRSMRMNYILGTLRRVREQERR